MMQRKFDWARFANILFV